MKHIVYVLFAKDMKKSIILKQSANNIISRYQEKFQSDSYLLVLVFCDTDKLPCTKYKELKRKINEFHDKNIADDIVIFGNPCTMQIILSHFSEIKLITQSKKINSKYIYKYTGIRNYKATEIQRKKLFSKINRDNYQIMKKNTKKLSNNDTIVSSTNILSFLEKFENNNADWINDINNELLY